MPRLSQIDKLTLEPHKVYNSQLYLVPYFLSLWKRVKSATRGVLSPLESTKIVFVFGRGSVPDLAKEAYDAILEP